MINTGLARAAVILVFFALLALSALTGFPESFIKPPFPRGLDALKFIVSLAVEPFGEEGGAIFFAVFGLILAALVARGSAGQARNDRTRSKPRKHAPDQGDVVAPSDVARFGRKRALVAGASVSSVRSRPTPEEDNYLQEMFDILEQHREPGPVPAWGLELRSPFDNWEGATSWIGGGPKVPPDFVWPRDQDGVPFFFLAQIDLAAIKPNPQTGSRRSALPDRGAMLIFAGLDCAVRIVGHEAMQAAIPLSQPDDMPLISHWGFWIAGHSFHYWPVDLVPYLSVDADTGNSGRPVAYPFDNKPEPTPNPDVRMRAHRLINTLDLPRSRADNADKLRACPKDCQAYTLSHLGLQGWRGHRLFGIEPDFENNWEDLRGWSCLISIAGDVMLGTETANASGMSIWFKTEDLVAGRFEEGQMVWRCSV